MTDVLSTEKDWNLLRIAILRAIYEGEKERARLRTQIDELEKRLDKIEQKQVRFIGMITGGLLLLRELVANLMSLKS